MPAIVALVAGNFPQERRSAAYGLIAAAGAIAVAAGPLIGGAVTTFASWRWVFVGEVVIVAVILRRAAQDPGHAGPRPGCAFDLFGAVLSIVGLSLTVFGVLRSGTWGFVRPKPGGPVVLGVSPVVWLVLGGLLVIAGLLAWESHLEHGGGEPLFRPSMFHNVQMTGGLVAFFFQFMVQSGIFFTIPAVPLRGAGAECPPDRAPPPPPLGDPAPRRPPRTPPGPEGLSPDRWSVSACS